jgi:hypothetical protein
MIDPAPNRLVRDQNPTLRQQIFHIAKTEREPKIQPYSLVYDLRREPVAGVADFLHSFRYRTARPTASRRSRDTAPFSPFAHAVSAKGARKARTAIETRIQVLHSPPTEPREGAFSSIISWDGARIGGAVVETAFTRNGEFVASGPDPCSPIWRRADLAAGLVISNTNAPTDRSDQRGLVSKIRPGDVLIVVKLDRLGRNTRDVLNLVHELEEKELASRCMVQTGLGMVAEMELGFIRDRQRAGTEAAKAKGVYKRRPVTFDRARIVSLRKEGMGATEIAHSVGWKRGNVYTALKAAGLN